MDDYGWAAGHARAQADVVEVVRVGAAVAVPDEAVVFEGVVVAGAGGGPDRQREVERPGLEDALLRDEGHADAVVLEALGEQGPGQDVAVDGALVGEPLEGEEAEGVAAEANVKVADQNT